MTLISEDSKGKVNKVVTEIEALNSLQVVKEVIIKSRLLLCFTGWMTDL